MNRLRNLLLILTCGTLTFVSCKKHIKDQLIGRWQEVSIENPALDETLNKQRIFIDTVGKSTDSTQNSLLYGTNNIDTMRIQWRRNLDSFKRSQTTALSATWFEFRKDGVVISHSDNGLDSATWSIDKDDGALVLDESRKHGEEHKIRFEIPVINDTALHLKFTESFLSSTAIFRRVKKQ